MSMFSLQSGESQSMGRQILRRPRMLMLAHMHRLQHKLRRSISDNGKKSNAGKKSSKDSGASASRATQADHTRPDGNAKRTSFGKQAGQAAGTVIDTKDRIKDTTEQFKEQAKDLPVNTKYALHHGKSKIIDGISDFKTSATDTRKARQQGRKDKQDQRRMTIAERRSKMEQERQCKTKNATEPRNRDYSNHERPATSDMQGGTAYPGKGDKIENIRRATRAGTSDKKSIDRPNEIIVKEPIEHQKGSNVDEPLSKKERKLVKPDKVSIKAERKFVSDSQNKRAFSLEKRQQKAVYHNSTEKEPQRQFIKERRVTIKRGIGTQKRVKITNAATAIKKRGQKK